MPDVYVKISEVTKHFATNSGSVHAVDAVTQDIHAGQFISIVGPSGCGKSTLLSMVAGLGDPTEGYISVGETVVQHPLAEVGMMFQAPVLLDWRTAIDNVLLPIHMARGGRAAKQMEDRAAQLLKTVGLDGFERRYPRELSGGMQQRVAICRMLITDPKLLLMDEPFGALDELTRERMNIELARLVSDDQNTAMFVTHNISEAVFLSDEVWVMSPRPGRICGVVPIDLPRPRTLAMTTTEDYQKAVRRIRGVMDEWYEGESATAPEKTEVGR